MKDDSGKSTTWPAYGSTAKISKGSTYTIDEPLSRFTIGGPVSKTYTVSATEVDGGLNGKDDFGSNAITLDLTPDMQLTPKSVLVDLAGGKQGQIQVGYCWSSQIAEIETDLSPPAIHAGERESLFTNVRTRVP